MKQGLKFPVAGSPEKIIYEFDTRTNEAFVETIAAIKSFKYARYTPLLYLRDKEKSAKQLTAQHNMGGFMKGVLVKRLESSFNEPTYSEEHAKRPGIFQIYKDNGGKFRFRVKSSNKETVGHSQGYTTKANCKSGINAVINACKTADVIDTTKEDYVSAVGRATFEVYRDNEMKFRFRLVAANTANILASQGYTAKSNCLNGIKAVKAICINHKVEDTTLINK